MRQKFLYVKCGWASAENASCVCDCNKEAFPPIILTTGENGRKENKNRNAVMYVECLWLIRVTNSRPGLLILPYAKRWIDDSNDWQAILQAVKNGRNIETSTRVAYIWCVGLRTGPTFTYSLATAIYSLQFSYRTKLRWKQALSRAIKDARLSVGKCLNQRESVQ